MTWYLVNNSLGGPSRLFKPDVTKAGVQIQLTHANMNPNNWYASDWVITSQDGSTELVRSYIEWPPRNSYGPFVDTQILRRTDGLMFQAGTIYKLIISPPNHGGGIGYAQGVNRCIITMVD